ncbi:hypothetical protein NIES2109_64500 (plasmid) [Nostoc sp. HK-01]|nr:hypothetical protein NIES2109_64500 [Nostoc sp. HK-01]
MMFTKLREYKAEIDLNKYDEASRAKNSQMQNRVDKLQAQGIALKQQLDTALQTGQGQDAIDQIITNVRTLTAEVNLLERAWDLDLWVEEKGIDEQLEELAQNPTVSHHYADDGGEDDGMTVSDKYQNLLACSLFAILAVKGTWLGTDEPAVLHSILRRTGKVKQYDDNKIAAKVRYLAGMTPTVPATKITLAAYLTEKKQKGEKDSFIVDIAGEAHTFAAVWKGDDYKKVDETGSNGNLLQYGTNQVLAVWT